MWWLLLYVTLAGGVGGVVNALVTDKGFVEPGREPAGATVIYRPGWIGNVVVGAVAAAVSWGLYGPLAAYYIAGTPEALKANPSPEAIGLTLSSLVGAVLVGIGGARWLTNEVDKSMLKAAGVKAAGAQASPGAAEQLALASPLEALRISQKL